MGIVSRKKGFPALCLIPFLLLGCKSNGTGSTSVNDDAHKAPAPVPEAHLCPAARPQGAGVYSGVPANPLPVIRGHVAEFNQMGPPIRFTDRVDQKVELRSVYYFGIAAGPYVTPTGGVVKGLKIDGKPLTLTNGDMTSGCLGTAELGDVLLLFDNSMSGEAVTVVLTHQQLTKLGS